MSLNKTINLFLFGLFLLVSLVTISNHKINNLQTDVYAAAAGSPGGDSFTYVVGPDPTTLGQTDHGDYTLGPNNTIYICENSSNTCSPAQAFSVAGGSLNTHTTFDPIGPTGSGTYTFSGGTTKSGEPITITINASDPSKGTYQVSGDQSFPIKLSGYQAAVSALTPGTQVGPETGVVTYATTAVGNAQNLTATADVQFGSTAVSTVTSADIGGTAGPITFTLSQNKVVKYTQTTGTIVITGVTVGDAQEPEADFSAVFPNVPPNVYQLCVSTPDIAAVCDNVVITNNTITGNTTLIGEFTADFAKTIVPPVNYTQTCDSSNFSLSWLFCPFVNQLQSGVGWANKTIENLMTIPVDSYFSDSCANNFANGGGSSTQCQTSTSNYQVWQNFRDIALSLLVIAALVMVISTAIDVGPFDAYTVRKMLPRILVAVIAITFSWDIGRLLVQISNDIGVGISSLILGVIPGYTGNGAIVLNSISTGVLGWLGVGAATGVVALAFVGPLALFMLLLPAFLALMLGFLILIARQLIVVLCILTAPLAFIAFVMPGMTRIWKLWKDAFVGALVLFPLVMAVISVGALMAWLITSGNLSKSGDTAVNGTIGPFLALVLLIAPYFLIPRLARMSTGALGAISTGINNASQGAYKGLKGAQRKKMATSYDKAKKGDLWHGVGFIPGSRALAGRTSSITKGVGTGWTGHYGIGNRGKAATAAVTENASNEYMKSEQFAPIKDYDDALRAKTYANAQLAAIGLEKDFGITDKNQRDAAIEAARVSGGFGGFQGVAAAKALVNTGTGYADMSQMTKTLARAAGGSTSIESSLAGYANAYNKQVGRSEMSPSFGVLSSLVHREGSSAAGGKPTEADYGVATDQAFLNSGTLQPILSGRAPGMTAFTNRQLHLLEHGNQVQRRDAAINLAELYNNRNQATGANRDIINETMFKLRNDVGTRVGVQFGTNDTIYDQLAAVATSRQPGANGAIGPMPDTPTGSKAVDFEGNVLTGSAIQGMARVYGDGNQAYQAQQQEQGTQTPTPPPGTPGAPGLN